MSADKKEFKFDKFMKDILKREVREKVATNSNNAPEQAPQRAYHGKYSERWQNRIVWRKNK